MNSNSNFSSQDYSVDYPRENDSGNSEISQEFTLKVENVTPTPNISIEIGKPSFGFIPFNEIPETMPSILPNASMIERLLGNIKSTDEEVEETNEVEGTSVVEEINVKETFRTSVIENIEETKFKNEQEQDKLNSRMYILTSLKKLNYDLSNFDEWSKQVSFDYKGLQGDLKSKKYQLVYNSKEKEKVNIHMLLDEHEENLNLLKLTKEFTGFNLVTIEIQISNEEIKFVFEKTETI